jgi:hypothetical protein
MTPDTEYPLELPKEIEKSRSSDPCNAVGIESAAEVTNLFDSMPDLDESKAAERQISRENDSEFDPATASDPPRDFETVKWSDSPMPFVSAKSLLIFIRDEPDEPIDTEKVCDGVP